MTSTRAEKPRTSAQANPPVAIRFPDDVRYRLHAMQLKLEADGGYRTIYCAEHVSFSAVIRIAVVRGLDELEKQYGTPTD